MIYHKLHLLWNYEYIYRNFDQKSKSLTDQLINYKRTPQGDKPHDKVGNS